VHGYGVIVGGLNREMCQTASVDACVFPESLNMPLREHHKNGRSVVVLLAFVPEGLI